MLVTNIKIITHFISRTHIREGANPKHTLTYPWLHPCCSLLSGLAVVVSNRTVLFMLVNERNTCTKCSLAVDYIFPFLRRQVGRWVSADNNWKIGGFDQTVESLPQCAFSHSHSTLTFIYLFCLQLNFFVILIVSPRNLIVFFSWRCMFNKLCMFITLYYKFVTVYFLFNHSTPKRILMRFNFYYNLLS